ncbi:MAG TPA: hypothetical protein PLU22_25210 [Polyangiaceae bacterium]|nr:hypothetical protein [Polyangiaceae bacterium]
MPIVARLPRCARAALLLTTAGVLGAGCKHGPAAAKVDLARVDAACARGDVEAARAALAEAAEQNRTFREALDDAKASWGNADLTRINPCGVILEDLRRRLPRAP